MPMFWLPAFEKSQSPSARGWHLFKASTYSSTATKKSITFNIYLRGRMGGLFLCPQFGCEDNNSDKGFINV